MNWYKQSQSRISWDAIHKQLKEKLGREPLPYEVQNAMLEEDFSEKSKNKTPSSFSVTTAKYKDKLKGGRADDKKPSDFSKKDVEKGHLVEFEHTNDPDTAREIAIDHLEEHPDYYVSLKHMEEELTEIENRSKEKK